MHTSSFAQYEYLPYPKFFGGSFGSGLRKFYYTIYATLNKHQNIFARFQKNQPNISCSYAAMNAFCVVIKHALSNVIAKHRW